MGYYYKPWVWVVLQQGRAQDPRSVIGGVCGATEANNEMGGMGVSRCGFRLVFVVLPALTSERYFAYFAWVWGECNMTYYI